jgi:hypothetical protein
MTTLRRCGTDTAARSPDIVRSIAPCDPIARLGRRDGVERTSALAAGHGGRPLFIALGDARSMTGGAVVSRN